MPRKEFPSGNIWRSYRAQTKAQRRDLPAWHMALKLGIERPRLRRVRNVTFEDLSVAGYNVRAIEDGETVFTPPPGALPEIWNKPIPTIVPKVAILRDVELFRDGSVLLPDGNYCYFDTSFPHPMEDDRNFGAVRKVVGHCDTPYAAPTIIGMFGKKQRASRCCATRAETSANTEIMYFRPDNMNCRVLKILDPTTGDALIRPSRKRAVAVSGRSFSTRSCYPHNMGHFMHDMLSRIYFEELDVIAPGRERIIAPRFSFPMQRVLFHRIFAGYDIVDVPTDATLEVEELLLPANLCSTYCFNAAAISSLAKRLRSIASYFSENDKCKVYVSRRDGTKAGTVGRTFVNMEACEKRLRKLGYQVVEISKLDSGAQFRLWANCVDIVGIHGAGMMNSLMISQGSNYMEIAGAPFDPLPQKYCPTSIVRCAMASGHRTSGLIGDLNSEGQPVIDLDALEAILRQFA